MILKLESVRARDAYSSTREVPAKLFRFFVRINSCLELWDSPVNVFKTFDQFFSRKDQKIYLTTDPIKIKKKIF